MLLVFERLNVFVLNVVVSSVFGIHRTVLQLLPRLPNEHFLFLTLMVLFAHRLVLGLVSLH